MFSKVTEQSKHASRYQSGDPSGGEVSDTGDLKMDRPPSRGQGQGQGQRGVTSGGGQQNPKTISAPTSPLKEKKAGFFGKVSGFSQIVSAKVEQAKDAAGAIRVPGMNRDRVLTLLVIDDADTDW